MPAIDSPPKNPRRVAAGRLGAATRWGPPGTRTVKIGDLTVAQRRLVMVLIDAARAEREEAATAPTVTAQEVDRVSDHTTAA